MFRKSTSSSSSSVSLLVAVRFFFAVRSVSLLLLLSFLLLLVTSAKLKPVLAQTPINKATCEANDEILIEGGGFGEGVVTITVEKDCAITIRDITIEQIVFGQNGQTLSNLNITIDNVECSVEDTGNDPPEACISFKATKLQNMRDISIHNVRRSLVKQQVGGVSAGYKFTHIDVRSSIDGMRSFTVSACVFNVNITRHRPGSTTAAGVNVKFLVMMGLPIQGIVAPLTVSDSSMVADVWGRAAVVAFATIRGFVITEAQQASTSPDYSASGIRLTRCFFFSGLHLGGFPSLASAQARFLYVTDSVSGANRGVVVESVRMTAVSEHVGEAVSQGMFIRVLSINQQMINIKGGGIVLRDVHLTASGNASKVYDAKVLELMAPFTSPILGLKEISCTRCTLQLGDDRQEQQEKNNNNNNNNNGIECVDGSIKVNVVSFRRFPELGSIQTIAFRDSVMFGSALARNSDPASTAFPIPVVDWRFFFINHETNLVHPTSVHDVGEIVFENINVTAAVSSVSGNAMVVGGPSVICSLKNIGILRVERLRVHVDIVTALTYWVTVGLFANSEYWSNEESLYANASHVDSMIWRNINMSLGQLTGGTVIEETTVSHFRTHVVFFSNMPFGDAVRNISFENVHLHVPACTLASMSALAIFNASMTTAALEDEAAAASAAGAGAAGGELASTTNFFFASGCSILLRNRANSDLIGDTPVVVTAFNFMGRVMRIRDLLFENIFVDVSLPSTALQPTRKFRTSMFTRIVWLGTWNVLGLDSQLFAKSLSCRNVSVVQEILEWETFCQRISVRVALVSFAGPHQVASVDISDSYLRVDVGRDVSVFDDLDSNRTISDVKQHPSSITFRMHNVVVRCNGMFPPRTPYFTVIASDSTDNEEERKSRTSNDEAKRYVVANVEKLDVDNVTVSQVLFNATYCEKAQLVVAANVSDTLVIERCELTFLMIETGQFLMLRPLGAASRPDLLAPTLRAIHLRQNIADISISMGYVLSISFGNPDEFNSGTGAQGNTDISKLHTFRTSSSRSNNNGGGGGLNIYFYRNVFNARLYKTTPPDLIVANPKHEAQRAVVATPCILSITSVGFNSLQFEGDTLDYQQGVQRTTPFVLLRSKIGYVTLGGNNNNKAEDDGDAPALRTSVCSSINGEWLTDTFVRRALVTYPLVNGLIPNVLMIYFGYVLPVLTGVVVSGGGGGGSPSIVRYFFGSSSCMWTSTRTVSRKTLTLSEVATTRSSTDTPPVARPPTPTISQTAAPPPPTKPPPAPAQMFPASNAVVSVLSGLAAAPGAMYANRKFMALAAMRECPFSDAADAAQKLPPLDAGSNLLGIKIGEEVLSTYRGSIVSGLLVCVIFAAVFGLVLVGLIYRSSPSGNSSSSSLEHNNNNNSNNDGDDDHDDDGRPQRRRRQQQKMSMKKAQRSIRFPGTMSVVLTVVAPAVAISYGTLSAGWAQEQRPLNIALLVIGVALLGVAPAALLAHYSKQTLVECKLVEQKPPPPFHVVVRRFRLKKKNQYQHDEHGDEDEDDDEYADIPEAFFDERTMERITCPVPRAYVIAVWNYLMEPFAIWRGDKNFIERHLILVETYRVPIFACIDLVVAVLVSVCGGVATACQSELCCNLSGIFALVVCLAHGVGMLISSPYASRFDKIFNGSAVVVTVLLAVMVVVATFVEDAKALQDAIASVSDSAQVLGLFAAIFNIVQMSLLPMARAVRGIMLGKRGNDNKRRSSQKKKRRGGGENNNNERSHRNFSMDARRLGRRSGSSNNNDDDDDDRSAPMLSSVDRRRGPAAVPVAAMMSGRGGSGRFNDTDDDGDEMEMLPTTTTSAGGRSRPTHSLHRQQQQHSTSPQRPSASSATRSQTFINRSPSTSSAAAAPAAVSTKSNNYNNSGRSGGTPFASPTFGTRDATLNLFNQLRQQQSGSNINNENRFVGSSRHHHNDDDDGELLMPQRPKRRMQQQQQQQQQQSPRSSSRSAVDVLTRYEEQATKRGGGRSSHTSSDRPTTANAITASSPFSHSSSSSSRQQHASSSSGGRSSRR